MIFPHSSFKTTLNSMLNIHSTFENVEKTFYSNQLVPLRFHNKKQKNIHVTQYLPYLSYLTSSHEITDFVI